MSERRPWGEFETVAEAPGWKVKRIRVRPGESLSLQYHRRRAEHWVVVRGEAVATVGPLSTVLGPGGHVHVPVGETHRIENRGAEEVEIVEVQIGAYLGEDDIVRLEDRYGR